jgi:Protein of unknown function (DUF2829)
VADFGAALAAVKAGGSAWRAGWWAQAGYQSVLRYRDGLLVMSPGTPGEPLWPFAGAQKDILADDWETLA